MLVIGLEKTETGLGTGVGINELIGTGFGIKEVVGTGFGIKEVVGTGLGTTLTDVGLGFIILIGGFP